MACLCLRAFRRCLRECRCKCMQFEMYIYVSALPICRLLPSMQMNPFRLWLRLFFILWPVNIPFVWHLFVSFYFSAFVAFFAVGEWRGIDEWEISSDSWIHIRNGSSVCVTLRFIRMLSVVRHRLRPHSIGRFIIYYFLSSVLTGSVSGSPTGESVNMRAYVRAASYR